MNREQQIEDLTKLIQAKEIHPCDDDVHCEDCYCACKGMAEMIYKAGYRKVPKGSFICSGSETNLDVEVCNNCEMQQANELFERDKEIERLKAEKGNAVKEFAEKCMDGVGYGSDERIIKNYLDEFMKEYEK